MTESERATKTSEALEGVFGKKKDGFNSPLESRSLLIISKITDSDAACKWRKIEGGGE